MADAYVSIQVEEIDPPTCSYCALEKSRVVRATHAVKITGWHGPFGAGGEVLACERHAEQAADALRKSIGKDVGYVGG